MPAARVCGATERVDLVNLLWLTCIMILSTAYCRSMLLLCLLFPHAPTIRIFIILELHRNSRHRGSSSNGSEWSQLLVESSLLLCAPSNWGHTPPIHHGSSPRLAWTAPVRKSKATGP
ncbi:hypothetical protein BO85DRAFT_104658 [Aspergillus piperis CBS 112811]|uniref:Uncharacterized protein n=1 Tax=Aspergillus piperis CBS 112811 TaxID=1448313 RepID=A0A8G1QVQ1_9EURO|nr:hypothetical protein BO85DRAFT_104658 [Aspergillus piperis CBS 112811]RAH54513.1 hypothetical protein BO85DRAFT_104658 [Aspergillus piperis CBS 112811]